MIKEKLVEKLGDNIVKNSCLWYPEGEKNLRYFAEKFKDKNIIEIGTCYGLSAAVLSEYCEKVYTMDIMDFQGKYDVWYELQRHNIKFILLKDNIDKEIKIKELIDQHNISAVFIDGEHWYGQLKYDFNICAGIENILVHDYNDTHKEIKEFVDELKCEKEIRGNFVLCQKKNP
ncbi:MAG TPA: hypothetical protein ENH82_11125 [bacterium]|nr:hypothetical protein [bacterium]